MSGYPTVLQTNLTASARAGTSIAADATPGTEGAWTELISALSAQAEFLMGFVRNIGASGVDTGVLLDIGVGAAAAEAAIMNNILAGEAASSGSIATLGKGFHVPTRVANGARLSGRIEAVVISETAEVALWAAQTPVYLENIGNAVSYGADEDAGDASGTPVTAANGAFGTWTQIGTTSADHNLFDVTVDGPGGTAMNERDMLIEIGYGPNNAAVTTIGGIKAWKQTSSETMTGLFPNIPMATPSTIPSGTNIWARTASAGTDVSGVIIYGWLGTPISSGDTLVGPLAGPGPLIQLGV